MLLFQKTIPKISTCYSSQFNILDIYIFMIFQAYKTPGMISQKERINGKNSLQSLDLSPVANQKFDVVEKQAYNVAIFLKALLGY